jgi:fluoride exporter
MVTLLVTVAAGVGAVARYLLDDTVQRRTSHPFPAGTLAVNISGSFLLGLVVGWAAHHGLSTSTSTVVGAGFTGGYTTLSTWAWESLALAERDARGVAAVNVVGSLGLGLAAAAAGLGLALVG